MELETTSIRLPSLTHPDNPDAKPPEPLVVAHGALLKVATDAANRAVALSNDPRWSEPERARQLQALADEVIPTISQTVEVVNAVSTLCYEAESNALRKAQAKFDSARLLLIAQTVAGKSREGKLSALMRARSDAESAAAIFFAPKEMMAVEGLDQRLIDSLKDQLLDAVDPALRPTIETTRFAATRLRVGTQSAIDKLRELTRTTEPPSECFRRTA